jgi:hypothetical protein
MFERTECFRRHLLTIADIYYILYIEVQDAEETSFVH